MDFDWFVRVLHDQLGVTFFFDRHDRPCTWPSLQR
jgi:hypothetical protein